MSLEIAVEVSAADWSQKKQDRSGKMVSLGSTGLLAFEKIVIKHVVSHHQSQKKPLGHWEGVKLLGLCKVYPSAKVCLKDEMG